MTDVDRLFDRYVAEHRSGGAADPLEYLERVEGDERLELEALIDGYLASAPGRAAGVESSCRGSLAEHIVESLAPSITGSAGLWPTVLPQLRNRVRVKRSELVARLAAALGVSDRETKVADYYNRMEQGRLPSAGVSTRVLLALGEIVGQSADSLRRLGEALGPPDEEPTGAAPAFTRMAAPAAPASAAPRAAAPEMAAAARPAPEWDEVDELFRGGD